MRNLVVHIQPRRSRRLEVAKIVERLVGVGERLGCGGEVTDGLDRGRYVNVAFATDDLKALWSALREEMLGVPRLAEAAIVCCEGEHGWDDYLLLHHFDPTEPIDQLVD